MQTVERELPVHSLQSEIKHNSTLKTVLVRFAPTPDGIRILSVLDGRDEVKHTISAAVQKEILDNCNHFLQGG